MKVKKEGFFKKIKAGLEKTKDSLNFQIENVFKTYKKIDDDLLEEIEEILISADIGVSTTLEIIEYVKEEVRKNKITEPSEIKKLIKKYMLDTLIESEIKDETDTKTKKVILIIGVNGVGKTTSIGKLSNKFKKEGHKVIVAAADTFRAAAVEQLSEWCNRAQVSLISNSEGSDPAAVVFDSIHAAKARNSDILICDTAGRLHNKKNLMSELNKITRIVEKEYSEAKKQVLLVIDATTGQNGIIQAKMFQETCHIDGIILTKLDGTAKGGIVIPIQKELGVPVKYIGIGEGIDDFQDFDAETFINAILV